MKLTSKEYNELIKAHPKLKPADDMIKSPNTHRAIVAAASNLRDPEDQLWKYKTQKDSPWMDLIENPPNNIKVTVVKEDAFKCPPVLKFTIFGDPVGKPRQTRSDVWKKRPCVMRYRAWADAARASVPKDSVSLDKYGQIIFMAFIGFPKTYSKNRRALLEGSAHCQKPDVDNILKSVGDALFPEDKQIWKVSGEKRWDDGQGARIEVELR